MLMNPPPSASKNAKALAISTNASYTCTRVGEGQGKQLCNSSCTGFDRAVGAQAGTSRRKKCRLRPYTGPI
jgi:hypothetical protein